MMVAVVDIDIMNSANDNDEENVDDLQKRV